MERNQTIVHVDDPTPENDNNNISSRNTSTGNIEFVDIEKQTLKKMARVMSAIAISIILTVLYIILL